MNEGNKYEDKIATKFESLLTGVGKNVSLLEDYARALEDALNRLEMDKSESLDARKCSEEPMPTPISVLEKLDYLNVRLGRLTDKYEHLIIVKLIDIV
jgi:hypothetical protein